MKTSLKVIILGMIIALTSLFWGTNLDAMMYHLLVGIVVMCIPSIIQNKAYN